MNISEILKQVPEGTKLYSPIFGEVELIGVVETILKGSVHTLIDVYREDRMMASFYSDGRYAKDGECMLFPAKNQSWHNYQIPFNNGDIIIMIEPIRKDWIPNIAIFKDYEGENPGNPMRVYCQFDAHGKFLPYEMSVVINQPVWRKANPEEITNFIKEMHEAGYQFIGNKVIKIVKPKFRVDDTIVWYTSSGPGVEIKEIKDNRYILDNDCSIGFDEQNCYKIVKFDRTTLKPYDKVLVKYFEDGCWTPTLVSYVNISGIRFQ